MPAPFPGMDPFLESQKWKDFHHSLITQIRDELLASLRPRYVIDIEENVYLVREEGDLRRVIAPDLSVVQLGGWRDSADGGVVATTEPTILTLPQVDPVEEAFLVIRSRSNDDVVTVIEVLSPTNKLTTDGRAVYLAKRNSVLRSESNLVELDLLRGGKRLPTVETLPPGDYFAFVTRVETRPSVEVYSWAFDQPLPTIPIPLAESEPDVWLNLQTLFAATYDRAGYDYALKYSKPVEPPLTESQQHCVSDCLAKWDAART